MDSTAVFSADGLYRYELRRPTGVEGPTATFVMLNPSVADATKNDPTVTSCIRFARDFGCGSLRVVNLYALIETDPRKLFQAPDPVGPQNDDVLKETLKRAASDDELVIAAWGLHAKPNRVRELLAMPGAEELQCLGMTRAGAPRHPSRLPVGTRYSPWRV